MKNKMIIQRLFGITFLLISVLIIYIAKQGITLEEQDATACLITIPLGLYTLFTRHYILAL